MCNENEVMGSQVFIDTDLAKATDNGTGVLCQCSIDFINGAKVFKYNVTGSQKNCGSNLTLKVGNGNLIPTDENTCSAFHKSKGIQGAAQIELQKIKSPFNVQFCVELNLREKSVHF